MFGMLTGYLEERGQHRCGALGFELMELFL
jgi:hypothetical protein